MMCLGEITETVESLFIAPDLLPFAILEERMNSLADCSLAKRSEATVS
jgi:hypothetical protein